MRVLIACDKFKGALGAPQAGAVVADALRRVRPDWRLDVAALSDGGDGFGELLTSAAAGHVTYPLASPPLPDVGLVFARRPVPLGWVLADRVPARARERLGYQASSGRLAVLEMAAINGLAQVPPAQRDVWRSSTFGTGEIVATAAEGGADLVLLGVGGSATSDLGLGALAALGLRFEDALGRAVLPLPELWPRIVRCTGEIGALPDLVIACDVDNPLLGPRGAARVYGPQKGLVPERLEEHERQARRMALLLCDSMQRPSSLIEAPGAGAAGGIAFGLMAGAGARLVSGFALWSEFLAIEERLALADWVITAEGRVDRSSMSGKGPLALAIMAAERGKGVIVLAGSVAADASTPLELPPGVEVMAISPPALPVAEAMAATPKYLAAAVERWALSLNPRSA